MGNQAYHDFIKTQLQGTTTDYVFGGESHWSYYNGSLTFDTANLETLRMDKKYVIPFTIASYESEVQPLITVNVKKYVLPIVFSIKYEYKEEWITLIETFASGLNGTQHSVGGVDVAFGITGLSHNGNSIELSADDWFQVTLTVYAYEGNVYKGNGMTYSFNGVLIEPLNYTHTMQNDIQSYTPADNDFSKNKSNGKTHTISLVLYYKITDADTIVDEIEGDTLNTTYPLIVTYPKPKVYNRTMMIDRASSIIVNGTGILFEVVLVDA